MLPGMKKKQRTWVIMNSFIWWISKILIGIVSLFLFTKGITVLVGSYTLNNPAEFLMYFFSSSMLILVSAVGIIYSAVRIFRKIRGDI